MASKRDEILALLTKAETLAAQLSGEDDKHQLLLNKSRDLYHKLLGPVHWARDIFHSPYRLATLQTAYDAGWLQSLQTAGEAGTSISEIADVAGADVQLVRHILRYLAANGLLKETATDTFANTELTNLFCINEGMANGLKHASQAFIFSAAYMPEYFASNNYHSPPSITYTPYAFAHGKDIWRKLAQDKAHADAFNKYMAAASAQSKSWMDVYPLETLSVPSSEIMLVDVGGGRGHVLANIASHQTPKTGQLILQDKPEVLSQVPPEWSSLFTTQPHDFFEPQKSLNARSYYLRFVLHDWSDGKCIEILKHMRDAMKPGYSTLFINDHVLPDTGCSSGVAGFDIIMMSLCGSKERTRGEWMALIEGVDGLKVKKVWEVQVGGESLIEVVRE